MRRIFTTFGFIGLLMMTAGLQAGSLEERLDTLERELEVLRSRVEQLEGLNKVPEAKPATAAPAPQTGIPSVSATAQAYIQYFLLERDAVRHDVQPPPLAEGLYEVPEELLLDPVSYGVEAGAFSEYRDPSQYPVATLHLSAKLTVPVSGRYELLIRPRPAREGASPVTVTMDVKLDVDGQEWLALRDTGSWKPVRSEMELTAGEHALELHVVSHSPGYGPSAVDSRIVFELRGPGVASPIALNRFLSPP